MIHDMEELSDAQRQLLSDLFDELVQTPNPGVPGPRVRRTAPGDDKAERAAFIASLIPRYLVQTGSAPNDSYCHSLEGLLASATGAEARGWIEVTLLRLDEGARQPPEQGFFAGYAWNELVAIGASHDVHLDDVDVERVDRVLQVAGLCAGAGHREDSPRLRSWAPPADWELLSEMRTADEVLEYRQGRRLRAEHREVLEHVSTEYLTGGQFVPVRGFAVRARMEGSYEPQQAILDGLSGTMISRHGAAPDGDAYSPTPEGALASNLAPQIRCVLGAVLATLRRKRAEIPEFSEFSFPELEGPLGECGSGETPISDEFVHRVLVLFDLSSAAVARDGSRAWTRPARCEELCEQTNVDALIDWLAERDPPPDRPPSAVQSGPALQSGPSVDDGEDDLNILVPEDIRDRYDAVDVLGTGGFASVYLAVDRESRQRFALKVTRNDREAQRRALRELDAAKLLHPNILRVVDADTKGLWFLMPLAEGTLGQLQHWGSLSATAAVDLARAVGAALAYAHAEGFLHRDLHPDNVVQHGGVWKVMDWGMAVAPHRSRFTRTFSGGGPEFWFAPEHLKSVKYADQRSDLFSLGRLVQWLATNQLPDPTSPGELDSRDPVAAFVHAATQLEPSARPHSMADALALLDAGPPVPSAPTRANEVPPARAPLAAPSPVDAIRAVSAGTANADARVRRFMEALVESLDDIAPVTTRDGDGPDAARLLEAVTAASDRIAAFAAAAAAMAEHDNVPALRAAVRGFGPFLERYSYRPSVPNPDTVSADFFRFLSYQQYLVLVAALLRDERYESLGAVLSERMMAEDEGGRGMHGFEELSRPTYLLNEQSPSAGRVSLQADKLVELHSTSPLLEIVPWESVLEADLFLYLRTELAPEQSPTSPMTGEPIWRPLCAPRLARFRPPFLVRASEIGFADRLAATLGLPDGGVLRQRYSERVKNLQVFVGEGSFLGVRLLSEMKLAVD
jgi:serine/threonine protein kinase